MDDADVSKLFGVVFICVVDGAGSVFSVKDMRSGQLAVDICLTSCHSQFWVYHYANNDSIFSSYD